MIASRNVMLRDVACARLFFPMIDDQAIVDPQSHTVISSQRETIPTRPQATDLSEPRRKLIERWKGNVNIQEWNRNVERPDGAPVEVNIRHRFNPRRRTAKRLVGIVLGTP